MRRRSTFLIALAIMFALLAPAASVTATEPPGSSPDRFAPAGATPEYPMKVDWYRRSLSNGRLTVIGEVINTSRYRLRGWVNGAVYPGGNASGIPFLYALLLGNLAPGQRSGFIFTISPFSVSKPAIDIWAGGYRAEDPVAAVRISTPNSLPDPNLVQDMLDVEIHNTTGRELFVSRIIATLYDATGYVITPAKIIEYPSPQVIPAGEVFSTKLNGINAKGLVHRVRLEFNAYFRNELGEGDGSVVSWTNWFGDVNASPLVGSIIWLMEQGITGGCAPYKFCPTANVTRAQMAIFLVRAFGIPPATGPDHFSDDNGKTGESAINALFEAGITGGCAPGRFCPTASVTRAQMAMFLDRAIDPPLARTPIDFFDDDDGKTGEAAINRLAKAGITGGCGPRKFCPTSPVTRAQMAAFLQRALTD